MAGWPLSARTVIRSKLFEKLATQIVSDTKRCDEVLESVEWAIATNPDHHEEIPGTSLRIIKTAAFKTSSIPEMRLYFTIDSDDTCTLQFIEEVGDTVATEDSDDNRDEDQ